VSTYYEAQEYQAGTPPKVITVPREEDVTAMEDDIRRAKATSDVVVMSIHWGIHHVPGMLADYQFTVGHRAIDAGADLILGTHAHLIKGIEIYKGKAIFFSMGNFCRGNPTPSCASTRGVPLSYQSQVRLRKTCTWNSGQRAARPSVFSDGTMRD
jgi:poly-gamma-glutamate synthesis protein (capsule biosynthesis protein)